MTLTCRLYRLLESALSWKAANKYYLESNLPWMDMHCLGKGRVCLCREARFC